MERYSWKLENVVELLIALRTSEVEHHSDLSPWDAADLSLVSVWQHRPLLAVDGVQAEAKHTTARTVSQLADVLSSQFGWDIDAIALLLGEVPVAWAETPAAWATVCSEA